MKKLLLVLLVLSWPGLARADAVLDWNETTARAAFAAGLENEAGCVDGLHESRIFAMVHVAIHDALNAIERRSQPYAFDGQAPAGTSPEAAVAAAAHDVLVALFPQLPGDLGFTPAAATDLVEAAYVAALAAIPDSEAKAQGILIGQAAAAAILDLRDADGADTPPFLDFTYVPGPNPGDFQFIPGLPFAAFPKWGKVTPFVLSSSSQYRPKAPYAVSSKKYAADFNEVKSLGEVDSTTRTADQTEIALFWVEGSPQGGTGSRELSRSSMALICGRTRACLACSTSRRPMPTSRISTTSTSTSSGGRSPRSMLPVPTATRILWQTRRGIHWWGAHPPRITPQAIVGREAPCPRCWRGSSATRSASAPPA